MNISRFLLLLCIAVSVSGEDKPAVVINTQETETGPTNATEALKLMTLPAGFRATVFAAEPNIEQPIGMAFDDRGRLWIAECHTYAESRINFQTNLFDRIVILEDTNGDGKFDKRKVFFDKAQKLTSVAVGFGGVWALAAPNLLFFPDRDGDDVPDGPPQVILDGWDGHKVRHNIVNGLKWGPDGWLYGRHGILATSAVGKPGTPDEQRTKLNCGVWRFHPTRHTFEVVAQGTTNPWGHDWDATGQLFLINTVIGHLWHIVPGALYRRMYGEHFNANHYEVIEQTADHFHWDTGGEKWNDNKRKLTPTTDLAGGGHAHSGMMIYLGDNWPAAQHGSVFTVNLHGRRLNSDRLERRGTSFVGKHGPDFARTTDPWFRAVELDYGNDGGVYVLDWSDIGECHENDGVHRTSGRIYKITNGQPKSPASTDLAKLTDTELVKLLTHPNEWYPRHAQRLLQERAATRTLAVPTRSALLKLFEQSKTDPHRLRALWSMRVIGGTTVSRDPSTKTPLPSLALDALLQHSSEHVRWWAIQFLAEDNAFTPAVLAQLAKMAKSDSSGLVRLALASALPKIPMADRWTVAEPLAARAEDAEDRTQSLMIWYGIESAVGADTKRGLKLAAGTKSALLRQFIARRVTAPATTTSVVPTK